MTTLGPPEVTIAVVSLQGHDRLHRLLDSLSEHTSHIDYEVVIVESGSRVRDYTRRMNRAIQAAAGDVVVGLNDDVQVTAGWIDPLLAEARTNTWVCFPDQTATDGHQCLCGWAIVFSRHGLAGLALDQPDGGPYDPRFVLWCSDIDLARRLDAAGHPPVRVAIPEALRHDLSATVGRQDLREHFDPDGRADLDRYREKWGSDAPADKYALAR